MSSGTRETFNHDLLLHEPDRLLAQRRYPTIWHVLDHPELRRYFAGRDEVANAAKRRGRHAGLIAIGLGCLAFLSASAEHLIDAPGGFASALAVLAAVSGVLSVTIGVGGLLLAGRKRDWLHNRLRTERTRQFFFQGLVNHIPEIADSMAGEAAAAAFRAQRDDWFMRFSNTLESSLVAQYTRITDDDSEEDAWVDGRLRGFEIEHDIADLEPLFEAYRDLRINRQLDYANYKLSADTGMLNAPRRQANLIALLSLVGVLVLLCIHAGVVIGVFSGSSFWLEFRSDPANMIVVWIAVLALALRGLEEGFQPGQEMERYQQYRSSIRSILRRFDAAHSQRERVELMRELERVSFLEMRSFLLTNERARFVI
jgi:hypothetical protein